MQNKAFYRFASLFVLISLVIGTNLVAHASSSAAPSAATTLTFTANADAYVIASSPDTNYGTATTLHVDNTPMTRSYVRFSVSGLNGATIQSAKLRVYANSSNGVGYTVSTITSSTWSEGTVTYNNAPAIGTKIGSSQPFSGGTWVEVDVTSYVKTSGTFNMALTTSSDTNTSLASRESGANAPQLVVTLSGTTTTAPTATPAPTKTTIAPTPTSGPSLTSVILKKGPTLIYTGNNTKMRIVWQWTANSTFKVQWGTSTSYGLGNVSVTASDTTNYVYKYDISGLTPGTKYYYRLVVGSQYSSGSFFAAPASSATNLKFFAYGDTRTNGSIHNGLAGQVISAYTADPAFQTLNIHVGDWVSSDSESAWTAEWFPTSYTNIRKQDANIADIGVRGNHEGGATYWKRYWPEPFNSGGLYWSFDYGPVHIAMVDQYVSYNAGSAQYNWLKSDLANSTKKWKFVVFHEPGWSAGGGHANNTTVQTDLQPLFVQYGVSIVFAGHNHYYARANVNGVTHLTMGGGGAPQYTPASGQPNIVVAKAAYSFGEFTISGSTLTAKVISNSGSTIDSFTITR